MMPMNGPGPLTLRLDIALAYRTSSRKWGLFVLPAIDLRLRYMLGDSPVHRWNARAKLAELA